jgi:hypothetical protein
VSRKIIAGILLSLAAATSQAALLGRAALTSGGTDYQAYYDDVLDITWLADANAPAAQSFGLAGVASDGRMSWYAANAWITELNGSNYLGLDDWRLPHAEPPDPTCPSQYDPGGGLPVVGFGPGCAGSDMGHLFQVDGVTYFEPEPFANIVGGYYWSDYVLPYAPSYAVAFLPTIGDQIGFSKTDGNFVWAVRDGDIAVVPTPPAVWLFGSALGVMGWLRRKAAV